MARAMAQSSSPLSFWCVFFASVEMAIAPTAARDQPSRLWHRTEEKRRHGKLIVEIGEVAAVELRHGGKREPLVRSSMNHQRAYGLFFNLSFPLSRMISSDDRAARGRAWPCPDPKSLKAICTSGVQRCLVSPRFRFSPILYRSSPQHPALHCGVAGTACACELESRLRAAPDNALLSSQEMR